MGYDRKYGQVTTERGTIGEDEPVVVFRAQDVLLPQVLEHYRLMCAAHGSPQRHLDLIDGTLRAVLDWQVGHQVKVPSSDDAVIEDGLT